MATVAKFAAPCQGPVEDIIPSYLPGGGISLLAGAANLGKTALIAGLLHALQTTRLIFGHPARPVPIGYINADRGWDKGAGLWLDRAGVAPIPYYSLSDDTEFHPKRLRRKFERVDVLASFIDRLGLPPDSLVIVDPVSLFFGGNLLDYDACMVACHEIRAYLRTKRYTLLGTAHSGKLKADKRDRYVRTGDQILGSSAQQGYSDAILHLAGPEELDASYYQLTWHPHGAKAETHLLERNEQGLFIPFSGVDLANQSRVLALFPEPPATITLAALCEYADALPLSRATVKRVIDALLRKGVVDRPSRGQYARVSVN